MSARFAAAIPRILAPTTQETPMHRRTLTGRLAPACRAAALAACGGLLLWAASASAGGAGKGGDKGKPQPPDVRQAVGHVASPSATVFLCEKPGAGCRPLRERGLVFAGDRLLALPGLRGEVDLEASGLRVSLLGNLPRTRKDPALQSALVLRGPGKDGVELALEDGRALLTNRKAKGAVKVSVRFADETVGLDLVAPGTQVALELMAHWPPGAPFQKEPKAEHGPVVDVFLVVVKGEVNARLSDGTERNGLKPPVFYHWSNVQGMAGPLAAEKVPAWARAGADADAKALEAFRKRLLAKAGLSAGLAQALKDKSPLVRSLAVSSLAALGDLPAVLRALGDKDGDARRAAVTALRHWSEQGAKADVLLYRGLLKEKHSPVHAEILVGLLHPFSQEDRDRRETYETLIDYLNHPRPAIRELAAWQLELLAPKVEGIEYDAAGTEAERKKGQATWRKLLGSGKLPPK
jgi:hypothetical protein